MTQEKRQCDRCKRPVLYWQERCSDCRKALAIRATVTHAYYGCDTGCCGHSVKGYDRDGGEVFEEFGFTHPGYQEDHRTWAASLADEHLRGVPLDWEKCEVLDD